MVIVAVDDLMFASRISSAAKALGVDISYARSPEAIVEAVRSKAPRLVILDLNSVKVLWCEVYGGSRSPHYVCSQLYQRPTQYSL